MIGEYQLAAIYRLILNQMMKHGHISEEVALKELNKYMRSHSINLPIFMPEYYNRQQVSDPNTWNKNIDSIAEDLYVIEEITNDIIDTEESMTATTKIETDELRNKLQNLLLLVSNNDPTVSNATRLIPTYIDANTENTTSIIHADRQLITPGNLIDIFREALIPSNIKYNIETPYVNTTVSGNVSIISSPNNNAFVLNVLSKEYTPQTVILTLNVNGAPAGVFVSLDSNYPILLSSNLNNTVYSLVNDLLLINENNTVNSVSISLTLNEPTEIHNNLYIYTFSIKNIVPYKKIANKSSIATTTAIPVTASKVKISANISGDCGLHMKVNDGQFAAVEYNKDITIRETNTATLATPAYYSNDKLMLIVTQTGSSTLPDAVRVIGPYNCAEKIATANTYATNLLIYEPITITFGASGYITINGTRRSFTTNEIMQLLPGTYPIEATTPGIISSPSAGPAYEYCIIHEYARIFEEYINEIDEYPPYIYIVSGTTDNYSIYVSASSLADLYDLTELTEVGPLEAATNYEVDIISGGSNTVTFRFILGENSAVATPVLIETGGVI